MAMLKEVKAEVNALVELQAREGHLALLVSIDLHRYSFIPK
jgi:hypothetical protein